MRNLETTVVILKGETYVSGPGYTGYALRQLGFPEGPYLPGIAKLFIKQAKALNSKLEFETAAYKR